MAAAERLLVDTNILLEATDEKRPYHQAAKELIESHPPLVMPAQVVREYRVKTNVSLDTGDFAPFLSRIAAITLQEASARPRR